jgi:hypothetical protein
MNEDLAVAFPAFPFWRRGASLPCSGCQYIRGQPEEKTATRTSADGLEVRGGQLAAALIRHQVELDLLSFDQMIEASLFDGADMDECILAAIIRLDEAEALRRVKPFHGSHRHEENPFTT